ncbi:MAG: fluoride efflux transporter CrcB [Bacteroidota bacterium]|nr:fluoride efflux transporter CrcB [Bacteroidota bacterium]
MKIILAIGIGSFLGGISRYSLALFIQNKFLSAFPFGTMSVNIIGCFLIGLVYGLSDRGNISMEARVFLATGFLGGFTTFSAFSNDTISMLHDGQLWQSFTYVMCSVGIGLLATFTGISLIKYL